MAKYKKIQVKEEKKQTVDFSKRENILLNCFRSFSTAFVIFLLGNRNLLNKKRICLAKNVN